MIVIEAPNELDSVESISQPSVFLAGIITGGDDWQKMLISSLACKVTVFNPRRANFPIDQPKESERQILWEYRHLSMADIIVMWFGKATLCPICLYELGRWINSTNKPAMVGIEVGYARARDVLIQTKIARPDVTVFEAMTAEYGMQMFAQWIKNVTNKN